jgi:hypothetical protein
VSIYGPILTPGDLYDAAKATLLAWMPAHLAEVGKQHGRVRSDLPMIRSWTRSTSRFDAFVEEQLPACVIVIPDIIGQPRQEGDGSWTVEWAVGVGFIISGQDQDNTTDLIGLYTAAGRSAILQHRSLGGFAEKTRWIDESYNQRFAFEDSRTIGGGYVGLGVTVRSVVNSAAGPIEPPADPTIDPGEWGDVASTEVTIEGHTA